MARVVTCELDSLREEKVVQWLSSFGSPDRLELPAEEVHVARCQLEDGALAILAPNLLHRCPRLTYLNLSGNSITDEGCTVFAECLGSLQGEGSLRLRTLLLSGNCIGPEGAKALAWKFFQPPAPSGDGSSSSSSSSSGSSRVAYRLDLSENPLGDQGVQAVAKAVRHCQCYASLHLVNVSCGAAGGQALAEAAGSLVTLALSHNSSIPPVVLSALVRSLGAALEDLALGYLNFRMAAGEALSSTLSRCPSLTALSLAGVSLHDEGLKKLAGSVCTSGCPSLQVLDLAGNRLRDGNLLIKVLVNTPCLRGMNLECNELDDVALVALSAGIRMSPHLRRLNLARNRFGDAGVEALARVIQQQNEELQETSGSRDLEESTLTGWLIGLCIHSSTSADDCKDLRPSARGRSQGVEELDLSFNTIMDRGARALAEAVAGKSECIQPSLTDLNLYDTSIGHKGQEAISAAMDQRHRSVAVVAQAASAALFGGQPLHVDDDLHKHCRAQLPRPFKVQGLDLQKQIDSFAKQAKGWVRELPEEVLRHAGLQPRLIKKHHHGPAQGDASGGTGMPPSPMARQPSLVEGSPMASRSSSFDPPSLGPSPMTSQWSIATEAVEEQMSQEGQESRSAADPTACLGLLELLAQSQTAQTQAASGEAHAGRNTSAAAHTVSEVVAAPLETLRAPTPENSQSSQQPSSVPDTPGSAPLDTPREPNEDSAVGTSSQELPKKPLSRTEAAMQRARQVMLGRSSANGVAQPPKKAPEAITARRPSADKTATTNAKALDTADMQMTAMPSQEMPASDARHPEGVPYNAAVTQEKPPKTVSEAPALQATNGSKAVMASTVTTSSDPLSRAEAVINRAREALKRVNGDAPSVDGSPPGSSLPFEQIILEEPEGEAPSSDSMPASMHQVQRLERQVKELSEDVRRIDSTVTRLNPEPEQEQDVQSREPPKAAPQPQEPEPEAPHAKLEAAAPKPPASTSKRPARLGKAPALPPPVPKGRGPPLPNKAGRPGVPGKAPGGAPGHLEKMPFNRKLYWKPIDISNEEGTIFDAMRREDSRRVSFDALALQRIFSGESDRIRERARRSTQVLSRQQKKAVGVKLLSDNRARNVAIVLKRLPVTTTDLASIMWHLRWEVTRLRTDDLEQIVEVIPTQEEAEELRKHKEPEARKDLRDIERMVLPIALIKRGVARTRLLLMARNAKVQFRALRKSLASIRAACQSIERSTMLREVMALALDLGNYINHGDSRKGARAISISSLATLKDFKAGKVSSLHFLCASLHWSQPDCSASEVLSQELRPAQAASQLQIQTILSGVRALSRDCEIVRTECTNFLHEYTEETEAAEVEALAAEASEVAGEDGEASDDPDEKVSGPGTLPVAVAGQAWTSAEGMYGEAEATRYIEDPMKIRGSAARRLGCLRLVMEKLTDLIQAEMEKTAQEARATLRYCGMPSSATSKELPIDLESLLQHLADFLKVFAHHWTDVTSDLQRYQSVFCGGGGSGSEAGTMK